MNRSLCVVLVGLLALLVSGCRLAGDFDEGSSVVSQQGQIVINAAVTAPAGAGFAASLRAQAETALRAASRARNYRVQVKVENITVLTSSAVDRSDDGKTLTVSALTVDATAGKRQVAIEVFPASASTGADPLYKSVFSATVPTAAAVQASQTVDVNTTAQALVFDSWAKDNPSKTLSDFQALNPSTATLAQKLTDRLVTLGTSDPNGFTWGTTVASEVARVVATTATPTQPVSTVATTVVQVGAKVASNSTGITVVAGDVLSFVASGTWTWGGQCDALGTVGRPNVDEKPVYLDGANMGALIGRIGSGAWFLVGTTCSFTVATGTSGEIQLMLNERVPFNTWSFDNAGTLTVSIGVSKAAR